jgi:hypothetical protein
VDRYELFWYFLIDFIIRNLDKKFF